MIIVFLECAKLRTSRSFVPYVPTCLTCSCAYVSLLRTSLQFLRVLRAFSFLLPFVSSVFYVLYVPSFFRWLKRLNELQSHATKWLFHETFFLVLVRFSICCVLAFHISVVVMQKSHTTLRKIHQNTGFISFAYSRILTEYGNMFAVSPFPYSL